MNNNKTDTMPSLMDLLIFMVDSAIFLYTQNALDMNSNVNVNFYILSNRCLYAIILLQWQLLRYLILYWGLLKFLCHRLLQ